VAVRIGGDSTTAILLRGLTQDLRSGQIVPLTFVFRTAGSVTVQVPVAIPSEEVQPAPIVPTGEAENG
jgi:copper(I)-binding protein